MEYGQERYYVMSVVTGRKVFGIGYNRKIISVNDYFYSNDDCYLIMEEINIYDSKDDEGFKELKKWLISEGFLMVTGE